MVVARFGAVNDPLKITSGAEPGSLKAYVAGSSGNLASIVDSSSRVFYIRYLEWFKKGRNPYRPARGWLLARVRG
jgi:hypothetical protein